VKNITFFIISLGLLSGCASMQDWMSNDEQAMSDVQEPKTTMRVVNVRSDDSGYEGQRDMPMEADNFGALRHSPEYINNNTSYRGQMLTKNIGDYVQSMAQDLISNMEYMSDKTPVGVTHFALIDSDLQHTNLLGQQLAESFVHELHKFRIPVIDFKATEYIRVTPQGDFLLSRDFLELKNRLPMDYILTGTLTKHQGGYLVNARILGLKSKAVVATAQSLIPFYVVDALLPSEKNMLDGVHLIQG
jgi:TolB-like protein